MQKVYLLLRNNKQTGPHSLEELLQLSLQPFDLIWVEGKSYGWAYPSEIESLQPFLAPAARRVQPEEAPVTAAPSVVAPRPSKNIFVSLPVTAGTPTVAPVAASTPDPIEQKAEELRRRIQSYSPAPAEEEVQTKYTRTLQDVETEYTSWMFQKKTKKKSRKTYTVIAGIIGVGLLGGWWIATAVFHSSPQAVSSASLPVKERAEKTELTPLATEEETREQAGTEQQAPLLRKPKPATQKTVASGPPRSL